eukprot:TRINITY_DN1601_c0_g1_i1.p1 TRINITY_DN1601_c0_g1~~TRINITY_DN1601_c0_g1_i1.p1  ORF type:complete len:116 (+),score=15.99 TRINITY_DN1601_c0_g1_i1:74-421(+)
MSFALSFTTSRTLREASKKGVQLYRRVMKAGPKVINVYGLDITTQQYRDKIREEFRKHQHLEDKDTVDMLVFKGEQEFQETIEVWKTKSHVLQYFITPKEEDSDSFLQRFFDGKT